MNTNILEFGAIADGKTLNTLAIQKAIDNCAKSGGGKVTIPAGTYKSGTIWLRSNVELHLEIGAELIASDNMDDYNDLDAYEQNFSVPSEQWVGKHLIIAHEINNCAITGLGKINGNCHAFVTKGDFAEKRHYGWCHGISILRDVEKQRPGQLICFIECQNVKVSDITVVDSPCWSCFVLGCEYVQIRGIKVKNPVWMLNSDGIDIDASRYVTISDCIINTGDDAITLRGSEQRVKNKDMHCEYVTITNCTLSTGICAFRIGVGRGGVIRHARISNIVISQCCNLAEFCTAYNKNGRVDIEDVNFSNISATNTDRCIKAFATNGATIKNITMENIRSTSTTMNYIDCIDGEIDNFNVRNLEISFFDRTTEFSSYDLEQRGDHLLSVKNAKNVKLNNVVLNGTLCGIEIPVEIIQCNDLSKKECNF